ncbi:TonB-dependent siderophore receptor [Steroidobacter sp.]|uniref:TonB-dependent siderophore receptor n=1 Tax=Steroidobacter sp. TaxID=1978227 RepID=UPI0025EA2620|nr:TonB-dependent receptor [Steroidobacter sp.]
MKTVTTLRHALLAALATAACANAQPPEQAAPPVVEFAIGAQPLVDALNTLAHQAGLQLLLDAGVSAQSKMAPGLSGSFTAEAALRKLLADSDLRYEFLDRRTVMIRASSAASTGAMRSDAEGTLTSGEAGGRFRVARVDGAAAAETENSDNKGTKRQTTEALEEIIVKGTTIDDPILSSRLGDSLRERPQSVSIVTRERLEEQNLHQLGAALEQTTGITVTTESMLKQYFYSRGFQITDIHIDGGASISMSNGGGDDQEVTLDMALYEQVEVLRGADALFAGNGEPGGTIQLIRKRPTEKNKFSVDLSAGRWDNYRGQLDASGPLGFDGRVRGRAVYMNQRSSSYKESLISGNHNLVYGILEADVADGTLLTVGGSYSENKQPLDGFGLPRYSDGRDLGLPRSTSLSPDWSRAETEDGEVFARLDQRLGDSWSLRINAMRVKKDGDYLYYYPWGAVDPVDLTGAWLYPVNSMTTYVQNVADATLKGSFQLWGRTHKLIVGVDWQDKTTSGPQWNGDGIAYNPFQFDPRAYPVPGRTAIPNGMRDFGNSQNGIYAGLSLQVAQPLKLVLGGRYSNYDYSLDWPFYDTTTGEELARDRQRYKESDVFTPYAGLTYDLSSGWVAYGSFAEVYQSQASSLSGPPPGKPLDPKTGRNLEIGLKGGLGEGRAFTQFAIYQIDLDNVALEDMRYGFEMNQSGQWCCFLAAGEIRSRGFDAEISGNITERWNMFVGYTWNENEYRSGYSSEQLGSVFMPQTPEHLFKLWTTYRFAGDLKRLTVSAGVNAQSKNFSRGRVTVYDGSQSPIGTAPFEFTQDAYAIFNARAGYAITDKWSVSLNLNNLTDQKYYQTIWSSAARNWYGMPRSYTVSLNGSW